MKIESAVLALVCCMFLTFNCSSDQDAPTISITSPLDCDTVAVHTSVITVQASDNSEVEYVEFFIDNALVGTDSTSPYETYWSIAAYENLSAHSIDGTAYDAAGNSGQSDVVLVTIVNRGIVDSIFTDTVLVSDGAWSLCDVIIHDAPDSAVVDSIMVSVHIFHNSISDVDVYLRSPNGTVHQLWDNDFNMAIDSVTTTLFAGENTNGTWLLRIFDEGYNGYLGFATNFILKIFWKY